MSPRRPATAISRPSELMVEYLIGQFVDKYSRGIYTEYADRQTGFLKDTWDLWKTDFNMLPHVWFGIDDAYIWLICTSIYEYTIVHLQECISRVVLK